MKISHTHVQNNAELPDDNKDQSFKEDPLIKMLIVSYKKLSMFQNLVVNEMIMKYYSNHGQYAPKPATVMFNLYRGWEMQPEL